MLYTEMWEPPAACSATLWPRAKRPLSALISHPYGIVHTWVF